MSPIIFLHGILGAHLVDSNSLDFQDLYGLGNLVSMDPDRWSLRKDPEFDLLDAAIIERNKIVSSLAFVDIYEGFYKSLKRDFGKDAPIFVFTYDWRKSCIVNARKLDDYVEYLTRKLFPKGNAKFTFISHSMGGIVLSLYLGLLLRHPAADPDPGSTLAIVDRVIIGATPFMGSNEALRTLLLGTKIPFNFLKLNGKFRKLARTLPAVYELMPTYEDSLVQDAKPLDLSDFHHWQSNLFKGDARTVALIKKRIEEMAAFRDGLFNLASLPEELRKRMLILAGTGETTSKTLPVLKDKNGVRNFVDFDAETKDSNGDGTVHMESATRYKDSIQTLVVRDTKHAGFFEDETVQDLVYRFLSGREKGKRGGEWYDMLNGRVSLAK